jgi:hypothetical protein
LSRGKERSDSQILPAFDLFLFFITSLFIYKSFAMAAAIENPDQLITSTDPEHPANLIPSLCAKFWTLGWVTGTGGGCSIRDE